MGTESRFGNQLAWTLGTNVLLMIISLSTGMLLARLLGPDGRGRLAAIQNWPAFIGILATMGLGDALVYFPGRHPGRTGRYFGSAVSLGLLASGVSVVVGYWLMPSLLAAQSPLTINTARQYLMIVFLFATSGMCFQILRGCGQIKVWNLLRLAQPALWVLLLIVAWLIGERAPERLAMWFLVGSALLILPLFLLATFWKIKGPFRPDPTVWGPMLRYGLPSLFGGLSQSLNLRLDQLLMVGLLQPASLGVYAVAASWSAALTPLASAVASLTCPRVASAGEWHAQVTAMELTTRFGVFIVILFSVPLLLITPLAVPMLFGQSFAAAVPVALVLLVGAAIGSVNGLLEEGLRGLGQPKSVMAAETGGLVVMAILLLVLLRPFQLMGAATASLVGSLTTWVCLLVLVRRSIGSGHSLLWPTRDDLNYGRRRLLSLKTDKANLGDWRVN